MKRGVTTVVVGLAAALGAAGLAIAQGAWTTVSKDELQICSPVFGEVQRIEHAWLNSQIASACTNPDSESMIVHCGMLREQLAKSQAADPLDWFYAGNDECEDGDYPCFGPGIFNTPRTGREASVWTTTFVNDAGRPTHVTGDMTLAEAAVEGDRCIAQVWVKKYRAAGGDAPPPVVPPAVVKTNPELTACLEGQATVPEAIAKCDGIFTAMKPEDPSRSPMTIALMQMNAKAGKKTEALRYGDMLATGKTGADAAAMRCTVRMIVKWDLDTALAACNVAGPSNAGALEAAGQIHLLAGRWQAARDSFDAAHKAGGAGQALYLRGLASAGLGKMGEALKDMADGEAASPGTAQAYDRDGYSLAAVSAGKPLVGPEAFVPVAPVVAAPVVAAPVAPPAPVVAAALPPAPTLVSQQAAETPPPASVPTPQPVAAAPPPPPPPELPRFDPDGPRPAYVMALSPVAIQACEDDVRALQEASKSWKGTIDEISLKLGMLQRTIYAGRCAGHPHATNLYASAERIIADTAPRAATAPTTAADTTPVVTDCIEPVPVGGAGNTGNMSVFRNTCVHPVMVAYCNVAPATGSWAEQFACETRSSIALVSIPANAMSPVVFGRQINHLACRTPALPVASYAPASGLTGYCK